MTGAGAAAGDWAIGTAWQAALLALAIPATAAAVAIAESTRRK